LGNLCGGDSPKETAPGIIQMQMAWVVCHGDKHIPERRFRASPDYKDRTKMSGFRYCFVETKIKLFVLDRTFLSGLEVSCKRSTDGVGPSYFYDGT
jgi:hypothetical protein